MTGSYGRKALDNLLAISASALRPADDGASALWEADGTLLWTSPGGQRLADRLSADSRARLARLCQDLPPDGARIERLRLRGATGPTPVSCTVRRVQLARGGSGILVEAAGPLPAGLTRADRLATPAVDTSVAPAPAERQALARERPTARFVWRTNADGTFLAVSPELEQVVGRAAAVVGRTWSELADIVQADADVGAAITGHATWSGLVARWRLDDTSRAVLVELSGMPAHGADGRAAGQRGFGIIRLRQEVEFTPARADMTRVPSPSSEPSSSRTRPPDSIQAMAPDEAVGRPAAREVRAARPRPARPALSAGDRQALRDIARALGARVADEAADVAVPSPPPQAMQPEAPVERPSQHELRLPDPLPPAPAEPVRIEPPVAPPGPAPVATVPIPAPSPAFEPRLASIEPDALLERLPLACIVIRGGAIVFANSAFLALARYPNRDALQLAGLDRLFGGPVISSSRSARLTLTTADLLAFAVDAELTSIVWQGGPATLVTARDVASPRAEPAWPEAARVELQEHRQREADLTAVLDTATDGVILLDRAGRVVSLNRAAQALFGYEQAEVTGENIAFLLAPESHAVALDYLDGLTSNSMASVLNDGREVVGRVRQGGRCPLFMTLGRLGDGPAEKYCAVLRDLTPWKKAESELIDSRRQAERASAQKSDFLAKMSHEIRTPLNAMIGFAEVMKEERFGPIGNERYREYVQGIHASGGHVISLVNDLLDLAKVEAGKLGLAFARVHLNALVTGCVSIMQQQANRERVVLRTSLAPRLPPIVADERSMRQVILNILSNALAFTEAGGQVIIATSQTEDGSVVLRIRDTGAGMTAEEIEAALEPFRQLATTRKGTGTGLGLPLTRALTEANRGVMTISSARDEGTLVEIVMPATRVLAE